MKYSLVIFLAFCSACSENATIIRNPLIDTSKIAIIKVEKVSNYFSPLDTSIVAQRDTAYFALSENDLVTIDQVLNKSLREYNRTVDTTKPKQFYLELSNYKRQYVPYFDRQGHKRVWVNCFCPEILGYFLEDDTTFSWKTRFISSIDGGGCFFNLLIDLTTKQKLSFEVNSSG